MQIGAGAPPEAAIKAAFDFGKARRACGAQEADFSQERSAWVAHCRAADPLLPYLLAGFEAGFHGKALPWARQIEAAYLASLMPPLRGPRR